jgi:predicted site-specific integrase-resolvase
MLNVTVRTLQIWDKAGKLVAKRTPTTNRRYYESDQIAEFLGRKNRLSDSIVIYARVSSAGQKEDLQRQVDFLRQYANAKGYIVDEVVSEIGSGLNYNRKKLNDILQRISEKRIARVIVSHKDRFIRFVYDWFERYMKSNGCEIEVAHNEVTSPQEEMVQDLISIIHCFSCRIYGLRKYKSKLAKDDEL